MSRFLCVGSWAFGVVAFVGTTLFDVVFFGLVFFTVVFVFNSTPQLALGPRRPRLEDDDRGPGRAADRVAIEIVSHLAPSGPEAIVLVSLRRAATDRAR